VMGKKGLTRFTISSRSPMKVSKAGRLCAAAARSDTRFSLRRINCGTGQVPVPVPDRDASLVVPMDFAAQSELVVSETPVGRPDGGGGGVGVGARE
jgi:hypothetical protein